MILLGLNGPPGSGRDRIAKHLVVAHNWAQYRMVAPVRHMLCEGLGIDPAVFETAQWFPGDGPLPSPELMEKSAMAWGTAQWKDIWRALAAREIHNLADHDYGRGYPGIVISDLQDEEDCDWVRRNGGAIWHTQSIDPAIGVPSVNVKHYLDDETMLLTGPATDVGPLVDNILPELLARYVA